MFIGQSIQLLLFCRQTLTIILIIDLESHLGQSLHRVAAIYAAVVILAKQARALRRVGYRVVLEGLFTTKIHR